MTKPPLESLMAQIEYDPLTGKFTRRVAAANRRAGSAAGSINTAGYVQIGVLGRNYLAHRLAWYMMTGELPLHQIDHINLNRADNRWSNLRAVTAATNKQNCGPRATSKSGVKGVHYCPRTRKWVAQIAAGGMRVFLGRFVHLEAAKAAYARAAARFHTINPAAQAHS